MKSASSNTYISKRMISQWQQAKQERQAESSSLQPKLGGKAFAEDEEMKSEDIKSDLAMESQPVM